MYTETEILQKLRDLLQLKSETEVVEFKHAASQYSIDEIGKYFSALSNEANLKGEEYGWMVFGIEDKTHVIKGTAFKPSRVALDELKKLIADQTNNRITFEEIYEVKANEHRVILFQIPAAPMGIPIAYQGHYYGRDGESLVALNIQEIEKIRAQYVDTCYETMIAKANVSADDVLRLLDYQKLFELLRRDLPTSKEAILERMTTLEFINKRSGGYDITNMGALLLARSFDNFSHLQNRRVAIRKYEGTNNRVCSMEQFSSAGYAVGFINMVRFIELQTQEAELIEILRDTKSAYPTVAIREFVANALVHQDFDIAGMQIAVEVFKNRLVITNPGASLNEVDRLIDLPARSRNEKLAQAMYTLRLCERRGTGVDRAVEAIEQMQLPPYKAETGDYFTRITLYPRKSLEEMSKEERVQACYQHTCLLYEDRKPCNNQSIRERFGLDKKQVATASHIISDTIAAGLIKTSVPEGMSKKYATYVPYYC